MHVGYAKLQRSCDKSANSKLYCQKQCILSHSLKLLFSSLVSQQKQKEKNTQIFRQFIHLYTITHVHSCAIYDYIHLHRFLCEKNYGLISASERQHTQHRLPFDLLRMRRTPGGELCSAMLQTIEKFSSDRHTSYEYFYLYFCSCIIQLSNFLLIKILYPEFNYFSFYSCF
jgi:hypothetical protein